MTRVPLAEKLDKRDIDLVYEKAKLSAILNSTVLDDAYKLFSYLDNHFGCCNARELLNLLYKPRDDFDIKNEYLDYCEFFFNVL